MLQCPHCKTMNDTASGVLDAEGEQPTDGDALLCLSCGEWQIFEGGGVRPPTTEEYVDIGSSCQAAIARAAWVRFDKDRKQKAGK